MAKGDKQLQDLNISLSTRDEFNKNYNAVVDHAKHNARSMYLVTSLSPEAVTAQKILHPLSH